MAKKEVTKKQNILLDQTENESKGFFSYLRLGESYTSLILGIIVVIIATGMLLSFVHNRNAGNVNTPISQDAKTNVEITQKLIDLQKTAPNSIVDKALPTDTPAELPTTTPLPQPTRKPEPTAKPKPTMTPQPTAQPKPTARPTEKPKEIAKKVEPTKAPQKVTPTHIPQVKTENDNNIWTVQRGESLWAIAEKKYNSGDKWIDIARANNLSDPSTIHAGDKLKLPSISSNEQNIATVKTGDEENNKTVQKNTTQPKPTVKPSNQPNAPNSNINKITGATYDVTRGDNLWNIAERAYGDGHRWVDIARANNLANPRVIHSGNHFVIPR